jgi:hypothetical protein
MIAAEQQRPTDLEPDLWSSSVGERAIDPRPLTQL